MGMPEHNGWDDGDFSPTWAIPEAGKFTFAHGTPHGALVGTMQADDVSKDVLVVDDDPHLCEIITDVLEAEGHTTRTAANGQEAINLIRERKPQLILLDLMMPVMNGWELADTLKASPGWADIPIVFVTAAHSAIQRKPQEMGVKAIISKPFDIDILVEAVHAYAV
jgi:two-component system chemotaxis response regulator CheY